MIKTLRSNLQQFIQKIRASFSDYKVTLVVIALLTLYTAVIDMIPYKVISEWPFDEYIPMRALALFVVASLFIETALRGKKTATLCAFVAAALLSVFLTYSIGLGIDYDWGRETPEYYARIIRPIAERLMNCSLPLLFLGTIYYSYQKAGERFEKYFLKVFSNVLKSFLIYVILLIGLLIIVTFIESLFLDGGYSDLASACTVLITGFYLTPKCIMALREPGEEPGDFLRTIIKYVLPSMSVCEIVIVYLYMLKIFIRWQMPSNEIFSIVTAVFCLGMPVWIMAEDYDDGTKYSCLVSILPYIFAPLICLQIYAMSVRIYYNGMTPARYIAIAFVIFEIAALFIRRFKMRRYEILMPFAAVLIVIAVAVPGINMYRVSDVWQRSFLERYYEKVVSGEQLTKTSYDRLKGAYDYLKDEPHMQEVIEKYNIYEEGFVAKLNEQDIHDAGMTDYDRHFMHCCQLVGDLDVGDYQQISMLNEAESYNQDCEAPFMTLYPDENGEAREIAYGSGINVDFSAFRFIKRGTGEEITVDVSDFAWKCILYEREHPGVDKYEISQVMRPYNRIEIDDDTVLYLNHFEVIYDEGIKYGEPYLEWDMVNLGGILVTK